MRDGRENGPQGAVCIDDEVQESYRIVRRQVSMRPSGEITGSPALRPIVPLLLCDHAGNAFPPGYGTLGLPPAQLKRHIAYDIGAAGVIRAMATRLNRTCSHGAVAVLSNYSRLLIDLNRGADDPTLIMRLSDGAIVPGNHRVDTEEWDKRIRLYYEPYHGAIERVLDELDTDGVTPVVVSVHSFTPVWKGATRPWHAGILWDRDERLPHRLLQALQADDRLVVGDNQPYSGSLVGDCLNQHATNRGLANALVEVRQDLIAAEDGQTAWADRLCAIIEAMLADATTVAALQPLPGAYHIEPHGRAVGTPD